MLGNGSLNLSLYAVPLCLFSYTELANNINSQESLVNIRMIQIDCSAFKVSLVQICHQWQQSLIHIVLHRLEKGLDMVSKLIKKNIEK